MQKKLSLRIRFQVWVSNSKHMPSSPSSIITSWPSIYVLLVAGNACCFKSFINCKVGFNKNVHLVRWTDCACLNALAFIWMLWSVRFGQFWYSDEFFSLLHMNKSKKNKESECGYVFMMSCNTLSHNNWAGQGTKHIFLCLMILLMSPGRVLWMTCQMNTEQNDE